MLSTKFLLFFWPEMRAVVSPGPSTIIKGKGDSYTWIRAMVIYGLTLGILPPEQNQNSASKEEEWFVGWELPMCTPAGKALVN